MARIQPINPAQTSGKAKQLLDGVQAKLGVTPNMMKTMAHSAAALEAYLKFSGTLGQGLLGTKFGEQLALVIGQANACEYCVAAHTALGQGAGLNTDEIITSRRGQSGNAKIAGGLEFARQVIDKRGAVSDEEVSRVRAAGYSDGEIAEIVSHVSLNILTNYFNLVARTEVDFPRTPLALGQPA